MSSSYNSATDVMGDFDVGFSEFVELIGRVAVEGLQQQNYHIIFPTPFSKALAILTVWGVADLYKLEEVRVIRTDENYWEWRKIAFEV